MRTNQHKRLAVETPEERERRSQRMSTNQHERLTVEIHLNLSFFTQEKLDPMMLKEHHEAS